MLAKTRAVSNSPAQSGFGGIPVRVTKRVETRAADRQFGAAAVGFAQVR